jgi:hypothetical protein
VSSRIDFQPLLRPLSAVEVVLTAMLADSGEKGTGKCGLGLMYKLIKD